MSDRRLSDDDFILLGKGLSFCPKTKSHDKIKLAEELFKYTRRMRLKEFFFEPDRNKDNYSQLPFFNKKHLSFTPPNGRDVYLDFYIEAISQEILHSEINGNAIAIYQSQNLHRLEVFLVTTQLLLKRLTNPGQLL